MTLTDEAVIPESGHGSPNCQLSTDNGLDKTYEVMAANGQICPFDREIDTKEIDSDKKRTSEMTCFMDELCLNSPKARPSRSRSKTHSSQRKSSSSSRSGSSRSGSSRSGSSRSGSSRSSSSCSNSRSSSRSHSRERRYSKRYRRRSLSYSRSRSRSYSPCEKRHYYYRRRYRSPPRYRSRSRSYSHYASYHRSSYSRSRSRSRGRRYYGFIRRHYSPTFRSYGSRSRSRSCSRTSLRLSEKEKLELLEIAKVNAAKVFGKEIELPESLIKDLKKEQSRKTEDSTSRSTKTIQRGSPGSTDSEKDKNTRNTIKEHAEVAHKSPYMLWRPVTMDSKSFSTSLSPKSSHTSRLR